ncbi:hypothetical protein ACL2XP_02410 [Sodalis sp. RH21]|uniref:hypothetical protein n=1 Tax=unclassified Sodalis (in: enterobacteria) TaxID=2636512 RepID=UPI0039B60EB7
MANHIINTTPPDPFASDLRPVYVTNAPGNIINAQGIAAGIQAIVYMPTNIVIGNRITFHWGDKFVEKAYVGGNVPWVIDIKESFVTTEVLSDGTYDVIYDIIDNVGNQQSADPVVITVQGSTVTAPTLLAPTLPAGSYNIINQQSAQNNYTVTIPGGQPGIADGDTWKLYLRTSQYSGTEINLRQIDTGTIAGTAAIPVVVAYSFLQGYDGVFGDFYYEIDKPVGADLVSRTIRANIDTVPPGGF